MTEKLGAVAHAIEAVAALVDEDHVEALGHREPRLRPREQPALGRRAPGGGDPHLHRDLPALIPRRGRGSGQGLGQVREAFLAQHELAPLDPGAHERIAGLEDPAVHHRRDRLARGAAERGPEVAGVGVGVGVPPEVLADAVAKDRRTEMLLEHPEHGRALLVGQHVEHRVGVAWRFDVELDRPRRVQPVNREGGGARNTEGRPALPLGLPGVDREHLHERGERFVEPDAIPPRHRDEVAEPHVRVLVGDHVGDALELAVRGGALVHQQRRLAEGDRAEVLHRPGREVRDRQEIELVARVRQAVIVLEEAERGDRDLVTEGGEPALARHAPDAHRRLAHQDGVGRLQLADDERHEVGGHLHRVRERDDLASALDPLADDGRVRHGRERRVDHERHREHGLEVRLVPARKRAAGVGPFELRGGHEPDLAVRILVARPVEAAELVVQGPPERQTQPPRARLDRRREREPAALRRLVEEGRTPAGVAPRVRDRRLVDRELDRVQDDLRRRLRDLERDRLRAREGERRQVGLEP